MLHLPRYPNEWSFFALFWLGGVWTLVYEGYFVMWFYHQEWNLAAASHLAFLAFLACVIYSNMIFLITTDVSARQVSRVEGMPGEEGWKLCQQCECQVPPRSHHCEICNTCILKRDHHCWFAGYCIGFNNHRYFVSLALYTCIAGVYANIYNWQFFMHEKGGFAWSTFPGLCAPHVGLFFGYYSLYEFALTFNTSVGFFFTLFFVWLMVIQVVQIVQGQVMYERKKGICVYNKGLRANIREVFGSASLLALFCPFVSSKLEGNGAFFHVSESKSK